MGFYGSERIARLRATDKNGRRRVADREFGVELWQVLSALRHDEREPAVGFRTHSYEQRLRNLYHEIVERIESGPRPVDEIFDHMFYYTNWDYVTDKNKERMKPFRHSIAVFPKITVKDNLSVQFRPLRLSENGQWETAPEWRDMPYLEHAGVMERPQNEVLFIRDVASLFHSDGYSREYVDPERVQFLNAACIAVNYVFWLEIERLRRVFDVHLGGYVCLAVSPGDATPHNLEIVDALREYHEDIETSIKAMKSTSGIGANEFWKIVEANRTGYSYDKPSKVLRRHSNNLTPKVVEGLHQMLQRGIRYGLWSPAD